MARARTGPQMADRELAPLLRGYSIEVTTHNRSAVEQCRMHVAPGTEVYIAFVPGETHHAVVATAARLHAAGFVPVPHLTARSVALTESGSSPGFSLLQTGLFQRHGIRRIGLACYPEAHRRIDAEALEQALLAKLELVRAASLDAWLVTQFCFEAAPILRLLERLRAFGLREPVRVGLAGPADRRTLWKYALHCGIGNSIRALGTRVDAVANLREFAAAQRRDPGLGIEGIHIFTFRGVASAASWANALLAAAPAP